jgi:hypothetical protein
VKTCETSSLDASLTAPDATVVPGEDSGELRKAVAFRGKTPSSRRLQATLGRRDVISMGQ